MTGAEVLPSSFRDPAGFLFRRDGVLYRQVNGVHRDHYQRLMTSGLYEALVGRGLLVAHEDLGPDEAAAEDAHTVIRPDVVPFVSYPYEWCFEALKDAALATLEAQGIAMDHGMSLRDASAFNVQFVRGRPVLIDTLSFEVLREGRPWIAYRQFCQHFLAPLALMVYRDVRLSQLLRVHLDGVPLDLAASLLPARARARTPLLLHLFMHARSQRRHAADTSLPSERTFSLRAFRGLLDSLSGAVRGLVPRRGDSHWIDYYGEADHYTSEALQHKRQLVQGVIDELRPATVWDLGANTGVFSRLASGRGIDTVAFDVDPSVVNATYREVKANREEHLLPLVLDLTNPSPPIGWANRERMTIAERGPADLALALALVHHLAIAGNVPLPRVAGHLSELCRSLVIEFVPKDDPKVRRLLATREDVFPGYTREGFEAAFADRFEIERSEPIEDSARLLYLMRARGSS